MSPERLEHLLGLVAPYISKRPCRSREPISAGERLVITLRYLATGDSQQSQAFNFRVGRATVCHIVKETCNGIWEALSDSYLAPPSSQEQWKGIADEFESTWNFPNCLGALDGKHIAIECPKASGSMYFNYKKFFSTVLMACCDANYCFTFVDIGSYGRDNDSSIFSQSALYHYFENQPHIPKDRKVSETDLPYVLVGDEIFPLKPWLMKPYPGKNITYLKSVYNYRLSRARRTIENTFGIYAARWRIFRRPIRANPDTVDCIVKATLCLHNYLRLSDNAHYTPQGFVDSEDGSGNITPGDWRREVPDKDAEVALMPLKRVGANSYSYDSNEVRGMFMQYFNSDEGALSWQNSLVQSCGEML